MLRMALIMASFYTGGFIVARFDGLLAGLIALALMSPAAGLLGRLSTRAELFEEEHMSDRAGMLFP